MTDLTYDAIHGALVAAVPECRPVLEEHVEFYGEVFPHVLFGDLTRFILSQRQQGVDEVVAKSLAFLEDAAQSNDPLVENLVAVSFVENVGPWDSAMAAFIEGWPPHLQALASEQGWPGQASH